MFSQSAEYAVRAAIEIATRETGAQLLASELAEVLDIPQHYLAKILQQLVRTRVLKSTRGRGGGFSLSRTPKSIKLYDIVAPFEDLKKYEDCILGQPVCNEAGACPLHDFWADVRERYVKELKSRSLADLRDFQLKTLTSMNAAVYRRVGATPGKKAVRSTAAQKKKKKKTGSK